MNRDTKISIIKSQLVKRAAANRLHRKVMAKVAESKDEALKPYLAGFCKAAEDAGIDPNELLKVAWTWGGVFDSIGSGIGHVVRAPINAVTSVYSGVKNTITGEDGGEGFFSRFGRGASEGWNLADGTQRELPGEVFSTNTLKNFGSGLASVGTGVGNGVIGVLEGAGGVVGSLGYGLTGNGFGKGWDAGKRAVGAIGIGDYDLEHASRKLDDWDNTLRSDYMERNNMDPNNLSGLESAGLFGLSMANAAGEGLGTGVPLMKGTQLAVKGLEAAGKTSKVLGAVGKGVNAANKLVGVEGTGGAIGSGMTAAQTAMSNHSAFVNGAKTLANAAAVAPVVRTVGNAFRGTGAAGAAGGGTAGQPMTGGQNQAAGGGHAIPRRRIYAADYENM